MPTSGASDDIPDDLSLDGLDERLRLLSHAERRLVVQVLVEADGERVSLADLVDRLVEEGGRDPRRVRLDLHHRHLPRLEDGGVLAYDSDESAVRYHGDELLEACLSSLADLPVE
jgi:hypothetical protein